MSIDQNDFPFVPELFQNGIEIPQERDNRQLIGEFVIDRPNGSADLIRRKRRTVGTIRDRIAVKIGDDVQYPFRTARRLTVKTENRVRQCVAARFRLEVVQVCGNWDENSIGNLDGDTHVK